jgi:Tol biopolymer transport system component
MKTGSGYSIAVIDMNNPQAGAKLVTSVAGSWESPSWAPDGRHLICVRKYSGKSYLYLVDSWYGKMKLLSTAKSLTSVVLPAWSPLY